MVCKNKLIRVLDELRRCGATDEEIQMLADGKKELYEALSIDYDALQSVLEDGDIDLPAKRIIWAMAKAERYALGLSTPSFAEWTEQNSEMQIDAVLELLKAEIIDSFKVVRTYAGGETKKGKPITGYSASIISIGKKLSYSLKELNEMTMQSFLDIVHAHVGDGGKKKNDSVREATQADIDAFLI